MGRSKRGKKKSQDSQQDDWEVSSERSFESSVNGDDYGNGDASAATAYEENPLEYITEALYEKRAATREQALVGLTHYLRSSYRYDECERWKETLCERLAVSLKKGKAKEAHLACLSMALLVLTLGADEWTEE